MKKIQIIIGVLLCATLLSGCGYNQIQSNEEAVFEAWGNLEAVLQRRADLIPNLVSTVKGYAAHESKTLTAVIEARAKATSVKLDAKSLGNPAAIAKFTKAQGALTSALSKLMLVVERYPDLKASKNFLALQSQLEGTENRIAVARKRYNQAVRVFNTSIRTFPNNLTNNFFLNLDRKAPYKADEAAKTAPKVNFGSDG